MKKNNKNWLRLRCRSVSMLGALSLFFVACQKDDIQSQKQEEANPAFTTELNLSGGIDTDVIGETIDPVELSASKEELRAASINLNRDPNNKKFKLNFDISKGKTLPVVVACRRTEGSQKVMYVGKTELTLLTDSHSQPTRKFRIEKKNVNFYRLNPNGTKGTEREFEGLQNNPRATYEVKLFVGAELGEYTNSQGVKRYIINYGGNNKDNTSPMFTMDDGGTISLNGIQGQVPFVSDWSKVLFGRNQTEPGVSNNNASILKQGLQEINLKAQGSILMFDLQNLMTESVLKIQKLSVYSESLTANAAYDYKPDTQDFALEPMAKHKTKVVEKELYYHNAATFAFELSPKTGRKVFVFWALGLTKEYLKGEDWVTTSVVAQIEEHQGVSGSYRKYWYHMPLLKTYSRLSRLHNGRATKTTVKIEDGTPVHPMNFVAHRFVMNDRNDYVNTNWSGGIQWRESDLSVPQDGEQGRLYATRDLVSHWRARPITTLAFRQVNQRNPKNFLDGDNQYYEWRPMSKEQFSALMPVGVDKANIDKTKKNGIQYIQERAQLELYQTDGDFWTIYERRDNYTYAIRHLRKTRDGQYYMTPYTAAFRYDHKGGWGYGNRYSDIEIRMRPFGGTTNQFNDEDGKQGYYSKPFSEASLLKLFSIVKGDVQSGVLPHDGRYWLDHPLVSDDVTREYPALGVVKGGWVNFQGEGFAVGTHSLTHESKGSGSTLIHRKEENYYINWYDAGDAAPVILLAGRKILQNNHH